MELCCVPDRQIQSNTAKQSFQIERRKCKILAGLVKIPRLKKRLNNCGNTLFPYESLFLGVFNRYIRIYSEAVEKCSKLVESHTYVYHPLPLQFIYNIFSEQEDQWKIPLEVVVNVCTYTSLLVVYVPYNSAS